MTKLLVLLALLTTTAVADMRNPPSSTERQYLYNKNNLSNGGFEGGKTGWSSAITLTTTSGQVAEGTQAGAWDPSASGTIQSPAWTTKAATTTNAIGSCKILTADSDYDLQVWDGTNVVAEVDVPAGTTFTNMAVNFVASGSTTYRIRLEAQGDESVAYIDDCYLGETYNLATVSQSSMYGGIRYAGVASCTWSATNTGGFVDFATDNDCTGRVLSGNATGPADSVGTRTPSITFSYLPAGNYQVVVTGNILMSNSSGGLAFQGVRLSDGTSVFSPPAAVNLPTGDTTRSTAQNIIWNITYDTAQTNKTFIVQANASASGGVDIQTTNANQDFEIKVYRYPLQTETAIRADNSNYGWTAYTPTFTGFGTVSGTSCYHSRQGENLKVRCKFVPGTTTATEARVSFPGTLVAASTIPTLELAGTAVINVTTNGYASVLREPSVSYFTFGRDGGGSTAITKFNGSTWVVSGNTTSFIAEVPISGWSENQNAPQLINSVITPYDGVWKTLSASFGGASDGTSCGSSPCTVYRSSGSWISSITRGGTGDYTINFAAGTFSAAPNCSYQPQFGNNCGRVNNVTTSSAGVVAHGCSTGTATDSFGVITCAGPR